MMMPSLFPLRWESTGNRWWFASPIDWAAANGHYDLVKELLHLDPNLLIKLTSLPRTRRLESVWDDEESFENAAKCRSKVAYQLLRESETKKGYKSLIRAGCGGWLMYTAAAAGDMNFVKELLDRDPVLVFGEGEYGVTDMFYGAARSKKFDVFRVLFEYSVSPMGRLVEENSVFRSELVNRAVHAATRGGGFDILIHLLDEYGDALAFRDANGSTLLHSAASTGQVQIVKHLVSSYSILDSVDNGGNTALHVAAHFGHYSVTEALLSASSGSLSSVTNKDGDTFLHLTFSGFGSPNFRRLDRHIELAKQLINTQKMEEIINIRNKDGRTPIHIAAINQIPTEILDLIMSTRCINLYIQDNGGETPLDLLKRRRQPVSRRMISFGGVSYTWNENAGNSPGTCFRIPDAEILLHAGVEEGAKSVASTPSRPKEIMNTFNRTTSQLKNYLLKPRGKAYNTSDDPDVTSSWKSYWSYGYKRSATVSLRQPQFSRLSSLHMNKRIQGNIK